MCWEFRNLSPEKLDDLPKQFSGMANWGEAIFLGLQEGSTQKLALQQSFPGQHPSKGRGLRRGWFRESGAEPEALTLAYGISPASQVAFQSWHKYSLSFLGVSAHFSIKSVLCNYHEKNECFISRCPVKPAPFTRVPAGEAVPWGGLWSQAGRPGSEAGSATCWPCDFGPVP